jgi:hypothetical protein
MGRVSVLIITVLVAAIVPVPFGATASQSHDPGRARIVCGTGIREHVVHKRFAPKRCALTKSIWRGSQCEGASLSHMDWSRFGSPSAQFSGHYYPTLCYGGSPAKGRLYRVRPRPCLGENTRVYTRARVAVFLQKQHPYRLVLKLKNCSEF